MESIDMKILFPNVQENAYGIAARIFADYWRQITDKSLAVEPITGDDLPEGDLVLIGADAANSLTHQLVKRRLIDRFSIRYGSDDYHMLSVVEGGRQILIIAGGCGRSTIYGVYDFFRKRGQVEYFWDGDIFHHRGPLDITNVNDAERPHFQYRGLRYFAHRGAHRFFPEMWNLDEWQREIDWALKKRFNLFMLRIGTDDLFQRAFGLPYPPEDRADPDFPARTGLWPLQYRGKLREAILAYARERGFIHPEDTGAMTHWYTPSPSALFEQQPELRLLDDQKTGWYDNKNELVWNVEDDRTMELYWQLTETHIREFGGGQPQMFHTIGLAERLFGNTDDENLQLKLYTLRRTQEYIRRHYPDTPLLVAGWDLMMWWKSQDVSRLCDELDPANTVIFDYNADMAGRLTYRECGLYRRFPWLFGMLYAFTFNNEMRGNYRMLSERLTEAATDEKCRGFLLWPELSHSDTFLLEFLADKSWRPKCLSESELVEDFCARRYPADMRRTWRDIWWRAVKLLGLVQWGSGYPGNELDLDMEYHHRLLQHEQFTVLTPERMAYFRTRCDAVNPALSWMDNMLGAMLGMLPQIYASGPMRRDVIDIVRSVLNLVLRTQFMAHCVRLDAWRAGRTDLATLQASEAIIRNTFTLLADLLEQNDDFSLRVTLEKLNASHPVNPATEYLLKEEASSSYCRNQTYEVVRHVYLPEMACYFQAIDMKLEQGDRSPFRGFTLDENERGTVAGFGHLPVAAMQKEISDRFLATPLAQMGYERGQSPESFTAILSEIKEAINAYLDLGLLP